jgi:hypothetical protein
MSKKEKQKEKRRKKNTSDDVDMPLKNCGICKLEDRATNMHHVYRGGFTNLQYSLELLGYTEQVAECTRMFEDENLYLHIHCRDILKDEVRRFLSG